MATDLIDYGAYEAGRDCNYWTLDPTPRYEAERVYPDDEFEGAEPVLEEVGLTHDAFHAPPGRDEQRRSPARSDARGSDAHRPPHPRASDADRSPDTPNG